MYKMTMMNLIIKQVLAKLNKTYLKILTIKILLYTKFNKLHDFESFFNIIIFISCIALRKSIISRLITTYNILTFSN